MAGPIAPVPAATLLVGCGEVSVEGLGTDVLGLLASAVAEEPLPQPQLFQLSHVGCDQLQAEPVPAPVAERQPLPVQTARPAHIATTSIHRENETRMASDPSPGRGRIVRRGEYSNPRVQRPAALYAALRLAELIEPSLDSFGPHNPDM